jgi:phosphoenolpyruvate-protein kinase (PTS system EI component)
MTLCVDDAKAVNANIKLGICGEHGGDPASVEFCHQIGLNYVSCSPKRVPVARLAAAQAALSDGQESSRESNSLMFLINRSPGHFPFQSDCSLVP